MVYAAIVRDEKGAILKAWAQEDVSGSPLWAEAKAALFAVFSVKQLGFKKLILEGDSLTVLKALNSPNESHQWVIGSIVEDTLFHLSYFDCWLAIFVKRDLNFVVDNLANCAFLCNRLGPFPSLISHLGFGFLIWFRSLVAPFLW